MAQQARSPSAAARTTGAWVGRRGRSGPGGRRPDDDEVGEVGGQEVAGLVNDRAGAGGGLDRRTARLDRRGHRPPSDRRRGRRGHGGGRGRRRASWWSGPGWWWSAWASGRPTRPGWSAAVAVGGGRAARRRWRLGGAEDHRHVEVVLAVERHADAELGEPGSTMFSRWLGEAMNAAGSPGGSGPGRRSRRAASSPRSWSRGSWCGPGASLRAISSARLLGQRLQVAGRGQRAETPSPRSALVMRGQVLGGPAGQGRCQSTAARSEARGTTAQRLSKQLSPAPL